MDLKLTIYDCLCSTKTFIINGIDADSHDFGDQDDHNTAGADDYSCGDMRFTGKSSTPEILTKYSITQAEYDEVVEKLTEGLSFGECGWCS